jgi:nitroreductase
MSEYEAIFKRRSIRKFKQEKVSDDVVKNMLRAAMAAPSAHNLQPWEFIVVRDKAMLQKLSRVCQYWTMLSQADFAVAVVANLDGYPKEIGDYYVQDCAACTQNMLVAAAGEGIGGVWLGCYPTEENMEGVSALLGLPERVVPIAMTAFGVPDSVRPPHEEYDANKVHFEKY